MIEQLRELVYFNAWISMHLKSVVAPYSVDAPNAPIPPTVRKDFWPPFERLMKLSGRHAFVATDMAIDRINLSWHHIGAGDLIRRLDELSETFDQDLRDRIAFVLASDRGEYFGKEPSPAVKQSFPLATAELVEANTSYSLERYTASVFHDMRAVEHGLNALSVALSVPPGSMAFEDQQWHGKIGLCESAWGRVSGWPVPNRRNGDEFFSHIFADLYFFKDSVRNLVSHTKTTYAEPGANEVKQRVVSWFDRLASKVDQRPQAGFLIDPALFQ